MEEENVIASTNEIIKGPLYPEGLWHMLNNILKMVYLILQKQKGATNKGEI